MSKEYTSQEVEQIGADIKDISQIIQTASVIGELYLRFNYCDPYCESVERLREERIKFENSILENAIKVSGHIEAIARLESQRANLPNLVSRLLDGIYKRIPDLKEKINRGNKSKISGGLV